MKPERLGHCLQPILPTWMGMLMGKLFDSRSAFRTGQEYWVALPHQRLIVQAVKPARNRRQAQQEEKERGVQGGGHQPSC